MANRLKPLQPLSYVRTRHQAALFAALCAYRPESFRPLFAARDAYQQLPEEVKGNLLLYLPGQHPELPDTGLRLGMQKHVRRMNRRLDPRPSAPASVRSPESRMLHSAPELVGSIYSWRRQWPRLLAAGWAVKNAILFMGVAAHQCENFESTLEKFMLACLETAAGTDVADKNDPITTTERVMRIERLFWGVASGQCTPQNGAAFAMRYRTRAVDKRERAALSERFTRRYLEPPPLEQDVWRWVVAYLEGKTLSDGIDIGAEAENVTFYSALRGRSAEKGRQAAQDGGLLHRIGLLENERFPAKIRI